MSEINGAEHTQAIFAQAAKLMQARADLAKAQKSADDAEKELQRLNGSTSIDLGRFDYRRYFTCDGYPLLAVNEDRRQELGGAPMPVKPCTAIVSFASYHLRDGENPPSPVLCDDCKTALAPQPQPKKKAAEKAEEVAF